jgi:3-methylcrotonyl-CoA carboxylase beta subunit
MQQPEEPLYPVEELREIAPADLTKPLDMYKVLARVLDGSKFDEFKPLYGSSLICGFGHIHGFPVGIVANNGKLVSTNENKLSSSVQKSFEKCLPTSHHRYSLL